MPRCSIGDILPDFTFDTPDERGCRFSQAAGGSPTLLLFLRHAGCPLTRYTLSQYREEYGEILSSGGKVMAVLRSLPEKAAAILGEERFPFPLLCDGESALYRQMGVPRAACTEGAFSAAALRKMEKARRLFPPREEGEDDLLQLPGALFLDGELRLCRIRYGLHAADTPSPAQAAEILRAVAQGESF